MPSPFRMRCMGLPHRRRRGSSCASRSPPKLLPSLHRAFSSREFFVSVHYSNSSFWTGSCCTSESEPVRNNQFRFTQPSKIKSTSWPCTVQFAKMRIHLTCRTSTSRPRSRSSCRPATPPSSSGPTSARGSPWSTSPSRGARCRCSASTRSSI